MSIDESAAIVRRIFLRAAERKGSATALARELGLNYADLRPYLYGEAIPPERLLLRAVEVIIDELHVLKSMCSERTWRDLALPASGQRR